MNKKIATLASSLLLASCLLSAAASASPSAITDAFGVTSDVSIVIDNQTIGTTPVIVSNTLYLPIRAITQALGMATSWDKNRQAIYLTTADNVSNARQAGEPAAAGRNLKGSTLRGGLYLDGKPVALTDGNGSQVKPVMFGGVVYLPLRALSEALGLVLDWPATTILSISRTDKAGTKEPAKGEQGTKGDAGAQRPAGLLTS